MKHLLTGVAIAAALVIATPTLAQTKKASGGEGRDAGRTPAAAAPAAAAPAAAPAPMAHAQRHHRVAHRHHMAMHSHGRSRMAPGDAMTEQLNREELARIQGAGGPPPMAPPPPPPSSQGPRPSSTGGYSTR